MSYFNIVAQTNENTVVTEYEPVKKRSDSYQSEAALENSLHTEDDLVINLRKQLEKLNNYSFTNKEWKQFLVESIANPNEGIKEKTRKIQEDYIQVLKRDDGTSKNIILLDKKDIHHNYLQVIHQYEVSKEHGAKHDNRYDVTILVNGFPLVHVELKFVKHSIKSKDINVILLGLVTGCLSMYRYLLSQMVQTLNIIQILHAIIGVVI